MVKLFILIKQKGAKTSLGAIPIKAGVTRTKAQTIVKKQLKPGYTAKIITEAQLRTLVLRRVKKGSKQMPKRKIRSNSIKRRTKRKKTKRR